MGDAIDEDAIATEFDLLVVDGDDDAGMPELADMPPVPSVNPNRFSQSSSAAQEDAVQNDERAALLASMQ